MLGAIILAGGKSTRMGQDKAFLPFGDYVLIQKVALAVAPFMDQVVIALSKDQKQPELQKELHRKTTFSRDAISGIGPLQGITDAARLLRSEINDVLVITCDLPYINPEWIEGFLAMRDEKSDVVCAVDGNYTNALLAIYKKPLLFKAEEFLRQGKTKARQLLFGLKVKQIPLSFDPNIPSPVEDMDNPSGYRKALGHLGFFNLQQPEVEIQLIQDKKTLLTLPIGAADLDDALLTMLKIIPKLKDYMENNPAEFMLHINQNKIETDQIPRLTTADIIQLTLKDKSFDYHGLF
ncbi:MAG: molybdenum cofactor guanylyltransferase [Deltaproteobacteria bacterium]|nr:molybdenum cofactor guanylyltransferase [Deltaproteobacteria bacterium]